MLTRLVLRLVAVVMTSVRLWHVSFLRNCRQPHCVGLSRTLLIVIMLLLTMKMLGLSIVVAVVTVWLSYLLTPLKVHRLSMLFLRVVREITGFLSPLMLLLYNLTRCLVLRGCWCMVDPVNCLSVSLDAQCLV